MEKSENVFHKICPGYIKDACQILERVLEEKSPA